MSSRLRALVAAGVVLVGCVPAMASARDRVAHAYTGVGSVPATGETLLVTFADVPARGAVESRLAGLGAVEESVPDIGIWALAPDDAATARVRVLTRPGVLRAEWSLVRTNDALTDARAIPPPPLPLVAMPEPTDPYYTSNDQNRQWGLRQGTWTVGLSAYDRPIIAILDSGIDATHEDWNQSGLLVAPRSTVRHVGRADDISDRGHGTHVSGIAAAPANGIGIVGIAPASVNPAVPGVSKLMPIQISDVRGVSQDSTMMAGIRWAVNHGAKVINISSGGPGASNAFQDTINWAYRRGALIIASVGNEGLDDNPVNFPAGYDHVIGVGALCDSVAVAPDCPTAFGRARFSNFNYSVDVLAPGVNVVSTIPIVIHEREVAPGYGFKDGTSMSAPYVAGVAALIYASHPGITPYQVTRILQSTSSVGAAGRARSSTWGWGAVNPVAAAQAQAPVNDLSEINDDVKWLPKSQNLRVTSRPSRLRARMDFNDDQFDTYPVILRKGERMRVTVIARGARLMARVYRPGTSSVLLRLRTAQQLASQRLGQLRTPTPGTRTMVIRARETGRHFVALEALRGGADYTLILRRI